MYRDLEARLHDLFWEAGDDGARELGLIKELLSETGGRTLELGCGSGRLLCPLLNWGFDVEGLERSPDMVMMCREKLAEAELQTPIFEADMAGFDLGGRRYQNILIPAFSLQLLPDEEAVGSCLESIFRHLEPEGYLYLSCFVPWVELFGELPEGEWYDDDQVSLPSGGLARLRTSYKLQVVEQRLMRDHQYEVLNDRGELTEFQQTSMNLRFFYLNELRLLLKIHGLRLLHVFPEFTSRSIEDDEMPACLSLVARKCHSSVQLPSQTKAQ